MGKPTVERLRRAVCAVEELCQRDTIYAPILDRLQDELARAELLAGNRRLLARAS